MISNARRRFLRNASPTVRPVALILIFTLILPIVGRAQEPSIDRLLRKLPAPEKLVGPNMKEMPPNDPASNDPLGQRAIMHANRGEYRSAIQCCRDLEAKYPRSFGTYCVEGLAAWAGRDYKDAAFAFRKAVGINPNAAFGHYGLALVESTQGHYAAALPHLQQLARLQPNAAIIYYQMSEIAWMARQPKESLEYAKKTAALAPSEWVAWAQVARGAASLGDKTGSGYLYLLAKYDGPNWGSEIWYVGDLSGTITIPQFPTGQQYGLSHVFLYNGHGGSVPDGGKTLMLLGAGLGGIVLARRFATASVR